MNIFDIVAERDRLKTLVERPPERVVAAAVQYDGVVFSQAPPARHHNIVRALVALNVFKSDATLREQGFLTSLGRYVSREEACRIARAAGQLEGRTKTGPESALFSEDLW